MPATNCPSDDELSAFLVGQLSEADIDRVADHLDACPECRGTIETLEMQRDTLVSQLRVPASAQPLPISAACERAMAAAEKLLDESPSAATEATLIVPSVARIRDYRIVEKLGQGGMGTVYKAIHERLDRIVAIKVLTPDRLRDPQGVSRFQREMKAVGKLQHPNIVNAHDAGEADGTHFLVMEYVDGVDLGVIVSRLGPLPVSDACELVRQAALGLQHVHQHGLVHRDIKPSNLMLTSAGQVKILDLGLALLHDPQQPAGAELTGTSQLMGTADYVSPEQAEYTHGVDIRADLYSLGCTLYKLLTGNAPFSGKEYDTPLKKIMAHVQQKPPDVTTRRPGLPAGLVAILYKLLAKDPVGRYATPGEVAAALAPFTAGCDLARLAARAASHPAARQTRGEGTLEGYPCAAAGRSEGTTRVSLSSALAETDGGIQVKPQPARGRWWRSRRARIAAGGLAATLIVLGIVISVRTPVGTIVLEMDQAGIAGAVVTVDGRNKITIRTGVGEEPIEVTADEKKHLLKVSKGGFETFTHEFTMRKGKNAPIQLRLVPIGATVAAKGPASADKTGWHGWPDDTPPPAIAPFDAEQAKNHQEAWAKYLGVPVEYTNSIGMKFRLIPPGEFVMGRKADELKEALETLAPKWKNWRVNYLSEGPQHRVILTRPAYLGVHEVTQRQYESVMGRNPSDFAASGPEKEQVEKVAGLDTSSHPVENVSWNDAAEFCAKLCAKEGLQPCYARDGETVTELKATGYRLPTEAEWECACRAGTTTKWWSGEHINELSAVAWMKWNSDSRTHSVGELPANPFGFHDMYGNVWEWVNDLWGQTYYAQFADVPAIDPRGPESGSLLRVIRGSAWFDSASNSSNKHGAVPRSHMNGWGFRVALSVDAVRQMSDAARPERAKATSAVAWPADAPKPAIAPFNTSEAKQHQDAWAAFLNVPVDSENSLGMKFRLIPPGEFVMGRSPRDAEVFHTENLAGDDLPPHGVTLTQAFAIGITEVTQRQWKALMGTTPWLGKKMAVDDESRPATYVSWFDADKFCRRLSERDGEPYRLPTEAEWEYACRAGTTTAFSFGDNVSDLSDYAWTRRNSHDLPQPVATKKPNPWGLFDMHGNAWEWCDARFTPYSTAAVVDPQSEGKERFRPLRGGCFWSVPTNDYRSAVRRKWPEELGYPESGFRVVRTIRKLNLP